MSGGLNAPFGLSPYQSLVGNGDITKLQTFKINPAHCPAIYAGDPVVMAGIYSDDSTGAIVGTTGGHIIPLSALTGLKAIKTAPIVGYLTSVKYKQPGNIYSSTFPYWPGPNNQITEAIAYVNVDPNVIMQVQVSTSTADYNTALFQNTWIGLNGCLSVGGVPIGTHVPAEYTVTQNPPAGNNSIGSSSYYLDGATVDQIATSDASIDDYAALTLATNFKIMGIVEPQNFANVGASNLANAKFLANKVPGVDMPFITVYGKFNNHLYGMATTCPRLTPVA